MTKKRGTVGKWLVLIGLLVFAALVTANIIYFISMERSLPR
jgi:hypothetical protein